MGRHGATKESSNDTLMTTVVGVLLLLLAGVCVLATF
jgi:hypothetical protein